MDNEHATPKTSQVSNMLQSLPIEVMVSVGKARPKIRDMLAMENNAVLPLDKALDDPVDLYVGNHLIARGQLEEIADTGQLAVRLTEVFENGVGLP
jgi:flagellar motor switch protein FliN/FliY